MVWGICNVWKGNIGQYFLDMIESTWSRVRDKTPVILPDEFQKKNRLPLPFFLARLQSLPLPSLLSLFCLKSYIHIYLHIYLHMYIYPHCKQICLLKKFGKYRKSQEEIRITHKPTTQIQTFHTSSSTFIYLSNIYKVNY